VRLGLPRARVYRERTIVQPPRRPPARRQPALPPFDQNDPGGLVHIVLPPEQQIPTAPDRDWWIGDAWGVTLEETPPFVPGANTTPREMIMSYLLPWYPRVWQDKILTAHAERGLTHFHLDRWNWQAAGLSDAQVVELFKYIQSWGFYTSWWATGSKDPRDQNWQGIKHLIEPFLRLLIAADEPEKSICVVGEELNSWNKPGADGLDDIIVNVAAICNPVDLPLWLHFANNVPAWPGPGVTFVDWWRWLAQPFARNQSGQKVRGCCWQGTPTDPAGTMSAHLWDTRKYLAAADADRLRVCAFELRGDEQLYGRCDEAHGALTAWEMICATRNAPAPNAPPVAGSMNGPRFPDGRPFLL
jgi:hypothetical protein